MHIIFDKKPNIRVTSQKPEELCYYPLPVDLLGRKERESVLKIEPKLSTKKTIRYISASEIFVIDTTFYKLFPQVEILIFWMF
jgi:hypothetical protein